MSRMPRALPLLGHGLELARRPLEFVAALREHGDVVRFRLGTKPAYMVSTPELVRQLLIDQHRVFGKGGPLFEQVGAMLGNGLANSDGPFHLRQRRLAQPAFHHARIADYAEEMRVLARSAVDTWDGEVDLGVELHTLTMAVLTRTLCAAPDGVDLAAEVRRALPEVFKGIARRAYLPVSFVHELPLPANRRFEAALARLFHLVEEIIADYRADGTDRGDLLSMLMLARDADTGETMDNRQLHDEIITMMLAGTETAATTLLWACHVLATHPQVQQRIHDELDEVLGDRPVTIADLSTLDYLRRVVKETMRRYPIAWLLTRHTSADTVLGRHHIPAGSDVFFSPQALHHDPRWFPDPTAFDPDRWLPERARNLPQCAYLPFGAGIHKCIGESFAMTQLMVTLATIGTRWWLDPIPGNPFRWVASTTYTPRQLRLRVRRRTREPARHAG